jgi:ubiquinone/menaquinone biosynthesis C-methylase UbiE
VEHTTSGETLSARPNDAKASVQEFWEENPCGSTHARALTGTPEFFDEVTRKRYELEPFIPTYADFEAARGLRVLEIGVGLGTDFIRFIRAGADATGVDLTTQAVELVRRRLEQEGMRGNVLRADAESLPFPDNSFDVVYSWGVLHHTPNTDRAAAEAIRVLRRGGRLCVMVYARHSWLAYGLWVRHALLRGRPWRSLREVLARHMESTGTKGYRRRELEQVFASLEDLSIEHVATPYDRRVVGPLAGLTSRQLGWFMVVRGRGR